MRDLHSLRRWVRGDVVVPGDSSYPEITRTWDLAAQSRPPVALRAATEGDIAAGARWADEQGLGIALRNTGHGAFSDDRDALVINTSGVNAVALDLPGSRATAAAGARWSDVTAVAAPHGLVGASGGSAGVGVVGYTLGGGLGPLGRTLGFAADRVVALTALDADYRAVRIDETDGDLFWALRGGGPLGIVTAVEFALASVPVFFGGGIYFDGADADAVLTAYSSWVAGLDERTTTSVALIHLPPAPQLPPSLRGRFVVHVRVAHIDPGSADLPGTGAALLAPIRSAAGVVFEATGPMTPDQVSDIHRDPVAPQDVAYRGGFVDTLDPGTVSRIVASMSASADGWAPRMTELRHLGGAYARSPLAPSSCTGRDSAFNLYVTAASTPETARHTRDLVDATVRGITPSSRGQLNFYGPSPEPGSILGLWDQGDAQRLLRAARELDPRARVRTGRPLA